MKKYNALIWGVAVALGTVALPANAYEKGNWIVRAGWAEVIPIETTGSLKADGVALPVGEDVIEVTDGSALGISATYMLSSHFGIELLAATPFEHELSASGGLAPVLQDALGTTDIGSTKQLPPTLTLQWYPMESGSNWQPYVGAGINFTWFFDEQLDSGFKDPQGLSDKDISLSDSFGFAALVGLDWLFADNWLLNASVMYAQIETEAKISNTAFGDLKVDVAVDPWVYRLNLGYRF